MTNLSNPSQNSTKSLLHILSKFPPHYINSVLKFQMICLFNQSITHSKLFIHSFSSHSLLKIELLSNLYFPQMAKSSPHILIDLIRINFIPFMTIKLKICIHLQRLLILYPFLIERIYLRLRMN